MEQVLKIKEFMRKKVFSIFLKNSFQQNKQPKYIHFPSGGKWGKIKRKNVNLDQLVNTKKKNFLVSTVLPVFLLWVLITQGMRYLRSIFYDPYVISSAEVSTEILTNNDSEGLKDENKTVIPVWTETFTPTPTVYVSVGRNSVNTPTIRSDPPYTQNNNGKVVYVTVVVVATNKPSTPTFTPIPTKTATQTLTIEPTQTATSTLTIEPTQTATPTLKIEPTKTATPTLTIEPTLTATPDCSNYFITPEVTSIPIGTPGPTIQIPDECIYTSTPTITATYEEVN